MDDKKKKILVVDDDMTVRTLLKDIFEPLGFEIDEAVDGQDGFQRAVTEDYFVVLMDLKMPNWNGIDAIKSMDIVNRDIRIVVVTGYIDSEMAKEIDSNPNVIGCFEKPFDTEKLLDFIQHVVPTKGRDYSE